MPDKPYPQMTQAELDRELSGAIEERRRRGLPSRLVDDLARQTDRTVPISVRVPSRLLERLKEEAEPMGIGYQTLLVRLVDAGLNTAQGSPPVRVHVPRDAVHDGHVMFDVELIEAAIAEGQSTPREPRSKPSPKGRPGPRESRR